MKRDCEPGGEPSPVAAGPTILVVDDQAQMHRLIRRIARGKAQVRSAYSLSEARQALHSDADVQTVLIDLGLPDGSGHELHQWVSQHHPALVARCWICTGGALNPAAAQYIAQPNVQVLHKPVPASTLRAVMTPDVA